MPLLTPLRSVWLLGVTQTVGFASSLYLPAVLAKPMAAELGVSDSFIFGGFSLALLISALLGPWCGRAVDRAGGRLTLSLGSIAFAAGLVMMALATSPMVILIAWAIMGIGMGAALYDVAFAVLVRLFGVGARRTITGVTLIAGFASTIGWPLTAGLEAAYGWRIACLAWAGLNLVIALPLHLALPKVSAPGPAAAPAASAPPAPVSRTSLVAMGLMFAAMSVAASAISATLPALLMATGAAAAAAVFAGALVGPAQVAARLAEVWLVRKASPFVSAAISITLLPIAALVLLALGAPAAAVFAALYGASNGLFTIVRGALPLAVFGPEGYGARLGLIGAPAKLLQAAAPLVFALILERSWRAGVLFLLATGIIALLALAVLARAGSRNGASLTETP